MTDERKPERMKTTIADDGETLSLVLRDTGWFIRGFIALWLALWTVGCVALAYRAIADPQPMNFLFGAPFWGSWIFVAAILVNMLFGEQRLDLGPDGLVSEWRVLQVRRNFRQIPLWELRKFCVFVSPGDSESGPTSYLEIRTLGKTIVLAREVPDLELHWLAGQLDGRRRTLQYVHEIEAIGEEAPADCRSLPPPADCRWSLDETSVDLVFEQRGQFVWTNVLTGVFVVIFWNAIVGVFVGMLLGVLPGQPKLDAAQWWGLCLFLIPFELVGLAMIVAVFLAILEPFRRTTWRILSDAVELTTTRFGLPLGWNRRFVCERLVAAEVRDTRSGDRKKPGEKVNLGLPTGEEYALELVERDSRVVCKISKLTLGEGQWMKGVMQTRGLVEAK